MTIYTDFNPTRSERLLADSRKPTYAKNVALPAFARRHCCCGVGHTAIH